MLVDFTEKANTAIGNYRIEMVLSPKGLKFSPFLVNKLDWQRVKYGDAEKGKVPNDKRGVYAFAVCEPSDVLPPHGHVLYIGIAGRKSNRSLRARYGDYLNPKKVAKRERIAYMIGTWHEVLHFFFAPVDDAMTSDELEELERQLNSALLPPYAEGDLEAGIKAKRKAFK